ncbi:hypothetical protein DC498_17465 [Terrimonas sp.]|uniref:hypothetical protein n=1 Tax=Terrimonas sp. TaxID=1914338 RepID=UPI000D51E07C|nr:hypothetical protein [Terrimonas sp.]PVD50973.1 hypothetical protein DC498_17465 [Terrimonas sp.]
MYPVILALHSLVRWLVLIALLLVIYKAYSGWFSRKTFSKADNKARIWSIILVHIEFILGLWLYFISPVIEFFRNNFKEAVHQKDVRFFGMEHSVMMLIAVILITIGSSKAKRKKTDTEKFRTLAIWFTIGLIIILISIPWSFSPFAARPAFRPF